MIIDGWPGKTDQYIEATSPGRDYLDGKGGNDILVGNEGNDFFDGGPGHDVLIGNSGNQQECCDLPEVAYEGTYSAEDGCWYDKEGCVIPPPPPPPVCPDVVGDTFHFRMCDLRAGGSDVISGWVYDGSHIDIGRDGSRQDIDADQFVYGHVALDANDRIIYNENNGKLWIDADGSGHKDKILVARMVDNQSDNPYDPGNVHPHLFWNDVSIPSWM